MLTYSTMEERKCKYCKEALELCLTEGLKCVVCGESVHVKCLIRGTVPGGLSGDVFFTFTCQECSPNNQEVFEREKLSWLQAIVLVFYHMQTKNSGLARKGYFHWRNHIASFIEKHWDVLFKKDFKKKKKLQGTIAGILSHFSVFFFQSGTAIFNEPAWWTLTYPRLTPSVISNLYSIFSNEKQKAKADKVAISDVELFQKVLNEKIQDKTLLTRFSLLDPANIGEQTEVQNSDDLMNDLKTPLAKPFSVSKKKNLLPTLDPLSKKIPKLPKSVNEYLSDMSEFKQTDPKFPFSNDNVSSCSSGSSTNDNNFTRKRKTSPERQEKLLDPFCFYNTSLNPISRSKGERLQVKLLGRVRHELILSPYSGVYLKPYIRRDDETFPLWLKMLAQIKLKVNEDNPDYVLPPRAPLDFVYVQPEHIPAINSLCNQFFWPGIDMTESLQYPEFSCVVLYKRLIVAFGFLVPNVSFTENYLSFLFTRPGWRNTGIARFIVYHLIQTSLGKDITLHVSVNNSALFLYQKFGFKVERVVKGFYDKYFRDDTEGSKNAFFCRLERSNASSRF